MRSARGQDLANGIKGSQIVMLEQTGHMMYMEQPEAFRTAVEKFLSSG